MKHAAGLRPFGPGTDLPGDRSRLDRARRDLAATLEGLAVLRRRTSTQRGPGDPSRGARGGLPFVTVRDVMVPDPPFLPANYSAADAVRTMQELRLDALPVCDDHGVVIGVVTPHDIVVGCLAEGTEPANVPGAKVIGHAPVTVTPGEPIESVSELMFAHGLRSVPVAENGKLVGMVAASDILSVLYATPTGATRVAPPVGDPSPKA